MTLSRIELPAAARIAVICARECGAKCCRNPLMRIRVRADDLPGLRAAAERLGIRVAFNGEPRAPRTAGGPPEAMFTIRHDSDGACPFLDRDSNLCRIHDERPEACRKFPHRPFVGCLLAPGEEGKDPPAGAL